MAAIMIKCGRCGGSGIDNNTIDENGNVVSTPCLSCVNGRVVTGEVDITEIMEELDYIHGKVTAIWNQVKPGE